MALCSASSNPLTQFTKHLQSDRGLQRDRLVHNDPGLRHQPFRTSRRQRGETIEEFARFNAPSSSRLLPGYNTRQEHADFDFGLLPQSPLPHSPGQAWGSEFSSFGFGIDKSPVPHSHCYHAKGRNTHSLQKQPRKSKAPSTYQANPTYSTPYDARHGFLSTTTPWQFQPEFEFETNFSTRSSTPSEQSQFPVINLEKTMEDFDWEALFASLDTTTRKMDGHADGQISTLPENDTNVDVVVDEAASAATNSPGDQILDTAPAEQESINIHEAFQRGMQIVHDDENLGLAVHAFQEATRADPSHFEAWKMLGSVLTEVDREAEAILAFNEALKLEANNLDVLMRLAVSHTNEGSRDLACQCLEQWMKTKYPQISIPELDSQTAPLASHDDRFERIKGPFIQAARLSLQEENIDSDVQVGLGVLMFSARLYDMAADCFHAAIQSTEPGSTKYQTQLHLLWNRYGACLGNVQDKEDMAIQAYETALALKPNFVKARSNLGVLYHNTNQPLMGAKNTLEAIMWNRTIQSTAMEQARDAARNGSSSTTTDEAADYDEMTDMYEMLMKCCSSMCRWDLAELVGPDMDLRAFRAELDSC